MTTYPAQTDTPCAATPWLRISLDTVEKRYRALSDALVGIRIHYAMKCNPDERILRRMHRLGCRFEIASATELESLIALGVDPETVLFSNPVKPVAHVTRAFAAGVRRFSFDSAAELDKLAVHAPASKVFVRITAPSGLSCVASEGKFGVDPNHAAQLLRRAKDLGLEPFGIAFHVGSQTLDPGAWEPAIERSAGVMRALMADGIRVSMLDIGGGFPARYGESVPDIATYGQRIRKSLKTYLPYQVEVVAEPGRALVAEAGVFVTSVIGIAERFGSRWVHLDVGAFNGMMEALETRNALRYAMTDSRGSACRRHVHVTGPSCDSQDTILFDVPLSHDLSVGDRVFIHSAGAYTTSYASTFNGFGIPPTLCY
jgi:ornithine decarboxylase